MKKLLRNAFFVSFLFIQCRLFANTVIVHGTVNDSANRPVANRTVKIYSTDSTNGGCALYHKVTTNPNGHYTDTLTCNGTIRKLVIIVENCNGTLITHDPVILPGVANITFVESNFIICTPQFIPVPVSCRAAFSYVSLATGVKLNSAASAAVNGDTIMSRTWKFGDSSAALTGNLVDPTHNYTKPGLYNVCLTIKTKKGCESQYCATVIVKDSTGGTTPAYCKAQFVFLTQGNTVKFNSSKSLVPAGDSITGRIWLFGDNSLPVDGNRIDPLHTYVKAGIYTACLSIKTKKGCESKVCTQIVIRDTVLHPTGCKAYFTYQVKDSVIYFSSAASKASSDTDRIISRTWYYSDGSTAAPLGGNVVDTFHKFARPGTYPVTLVIKTQAGCESKFTASVVIPVSPAPLNCKAVFSFVLQNGTMKFNSKESRGTIPQDSIRSRVWIFGDGTAPLQGNLADPAHVYTKSGKYTVTLYIKTKSGCESNYSLTVTVSTVNCPVEVRFDAERINLKKIQFNSSLSKAQTGDSIIQRNWKFGDNTILSGNEIRPVKEFSLLGVYTTCLQVRTLNGCEAQECKRVIVQDTLNRPPSSVNDIKIITINPNPVVTRMMATLFSHSNHVEAEITIYDIYGIPKLTLKRTLLQGNNMIEINCESLYHGPYFLKVNTKNGKDSKAFYKL